MLLQLLNILLGSYLFPNTGFFFCDLTQECKFSFVSYRLHYDPSVFLSMVTLWKHPVTNTFGLERTNFTLLGFADHDVTAEASHCLAYEHLKEKKKKRQKNPPFLLFS